MARLSARLSGMGFQALAVNHGGNRNNQCHPCIQLDLASDEASDFLLGLLRKPGELIFVHATPPSGTVARTRARKFSRSHQTRESMPLPLRSGAKPEGADNLTETDQRRVATANKIFRTNATFLSACADMNIAICVGHPTKSLMWKTSWFKSLLRKHDLHTVDFQQCVWGGRSDKWYTFRCNFKGLLSLRGACSGDHKHALWGDLRRFHADADYPPKLCEAMASAVQEQETTGILTFKQQTTLGWTLAWANGCRQIRPCPAGVYDTTNPPPYQLKRLKPTTLLPPQCRKNPLPQSPIDPRVPRADTVLFWIGRTLRLRCSAVCVP